MSKHTPGPWFIAGPYKDGSAGIYTSETVSIDNCVASFSKGGAPSPDDLALIAAAPELLAALQAMVPLLNSSAGQRYRKAAFAAIVKATGG